MYNTWVTPFSLFFSHARHIICDVNKIHVPMPESWRVTCLEFSHMRARKHLDKSRALRRAVKSLRCQSISTKPEKYATFLKVKTR